jgi:hypothetical protein
MRDQMGHDSESGSIVTTAIGTRTVAACVTGRHAIQSA